LLENLHDDRESTKFSWIPDGKEEAIGRKLSQYSSGSRLCSHSIYSRTVGVLTLLTTGRGEKSGNRARKKDN
jgi:hypothetical protein